MPVTLPFWGNSNPVQQAKQVANIEDINSYYDLAKVSSCYPDNDIRYFARRHPHSLNYFHILKLVKIGPTHILPKESWKDHQNVLAVVLNLAMLLQYALSIVS